MKNRFKAGDFVEIVPTGILVKVQYNSEGILEKVYVQENISKEFFNADITNLIKDNHLLPVSIPIKNGTTWVTGVLYVNHTFRAEGQLPYCILDQAISYFCDNPFEFKFYALTVHSMAASFKGAYSIIQWLRMAGFHTCPGWIIPAGMSNNIFIFKDMVKYNVHEFKYSDICAYYIFDASNSNLVISDLNQYIVKSVDKYVDESGYIKLHVCTDSSELYLDIFKGLKLNISQNKIIIKDSDNVVYSTDGDMHTSVDEIYCPDCGKLIPYNSTGFTQCSDTNCVSRLYPDVSHFLIVLDLPVISYHRYKQSIENKEFFCLSDIFHLIEYQNVNLTTSISRLLEAIIPVSVVSDKSLINIFVYRCKDVLQTVKYYLKNPKSIQSDLDIHHTQLNRLVNWLSTDCNIVDVLNLFEIDNLYIEETKRRFDGPPIFRGKTILLTGDFIHGEYEDVQAILRSYSADIVPEFSDKVDCVITGGTFENIDGHIIKQAQQTGRPIFTEFEFFSKYEIESDLKDI